KGVEFGKLSGAVGTYANIDPFVEKYVCENLGLSPAPYPHKHYSVIVMQHICLHSRLLRHRLKSLQQKFVDYKKQKLVKWKKDSVKDRLVHLLCHINEIQSHQKI